MPTLLASFELARQCMGSLGQVGPHVSRMLKGRRSVVGVETRNLADALWTLVVVDPASDLTKRLVFRHPEVDA